MSERPNRHQRRASQSVFVSLDDISAPITDNATANKPVEPTSNQEPVRSPVPPVTAAETSEIVAKDGEKQQKYSREKPRSPVSTDFQHESKKGRVEDEKMEEPFNPGETSALVVDGDATVMEVAAAVSEHTWW
ncbi:hypothetical protein V6N13_149042 [Hibiscus sabdariffa]